MLNLTNVQRGALGAATAMFLVGTLTGVSPALHDYPVYGGQAVRYLFGALLLLVVAQVSGKGLIRLTRREVLYLAALALTGLTAFNVLIVESTRSADPATVGTVVAAVPIVLALLGPVMERRKPAPRVLLASVVVVVGVAVTSGFGGGSALGLLLAFGALACEAGFSLLALPVLGRLGAIRVSAYSAALAVPQLVVVGLVVDGPDLVRVPTAAEALALGYLAVVVTVFAFLCWYSSLPRLGADKAGLFSGFLPVGAVVSTVVLGTGQPRTADLVGACLVLVGLAIGLRPARSRREPVPV
ncbi:DMT family transporter [Actinosynnema sp. NPDC047251]|uniref:Transmembrane protein n=1 Tax=Saccharothrix espanaensis (strain ATCC 51144 / DSM 44229 / JCM 9112 / NBRC 15066 / NRRL 15764) TaxID=1179773 RepID=K0JYE3_SACES|nr:DMT family transporter [Saccharothrix espanaensis]CCH29724.1 Transmembrane protein [Saccharothrix espanaensis DSM 44229]